MSNESRKKAQSKYKKKLRASGGEKQISISFSASDMELHDYAKDKRPTASYIKGLIKADMERNGNAY